MKKFYLLIAFVAVLFANKLSAQCAVGILTAPNTTQLTCGVNKITLTANATGAGTLKYLWSTGDTTASIPVTDTGTFTVTVTDTAACTASTSITITKDIPSITVLAFPDSICAGATSTIVAFGAERFVWNPGGLQGNVIQVSPLLTKTYTVTGLIPGGCSTTKAITIVVNPLPTATISGTAAVCQNAAQPSVMFAGTAGKKPFTFAYKINNGPIQTISTSEANPSAEVKAPTGVLGTLTYDLIAVTDSNGCTQPQSGRATISILPGPTLTSVRDASICSGALFRYTATSSVSSTSFAWSRPAVAGISNPAVSGTTGATISETLQNTTASPVVVHYLFDLSTGTGCVVRDSVSLTVNPTPAIDAIQDQTYCNGSFVSGGIPFASSSPDVSFQWTNSNPGIGLPASGSGFIPPFIATNPSPNVDVAVITVSVKGSADSCAGASKTFRISVRPGPTLTSKKDTTICNESLFAYVATSSANATKFRWSRAAVAGIGNPDASASSAQISERLVNVSSQPVVVKYIFVLSTETGCNTQDSVLVTVNPTPSVNAVPDATVCNGTLVQTIDLISPTVGATVSWSTDKLIGFGSSGTGNISAFNANNPGNSAVTATINVSPSIDGCPGVNNQFTITVLPGPVLASSRQISTCDNKPFTYTAQSSAVGIATSFGWTRAAVAGISNGPAKGQDPVVSETLHNTTPQPVDVYYVFSLSTGNGCVSRDSVKVTVNPTPVIAAIRDTTVCNGTLVRGLPFSSTSPNAAFTWTNNNLKIGLPESGSGNIPGFIATNNTGKLDSAEITVFITASTDQCAGESKKFKIYIRPGPVMTSLKERSVCNGNFFRYDATSSTSPAPSFSWSRAAVAGISNGADSAASATITETLHNTSDQPVVVKYLFNLIPSGGNDACAVVDSVLVTVNPTPKINPIESRTFCNGELVSGITFASPTPNVSFRWTTSNPAIGLKDSGRGSIPGFIATNNTSRLDSALITVFVKASADSCPGESRTFWIFVRPGPTLTSEKERSICNNDTFAYLAKSSATPTAFSWTRAAVTDISPRSNGAASDSIRERLHNSSSQPVNVYYVFTLSTGSGCITTDSVKVRVNPTPVIDAVANKVYCNNLLIQPTRISSATKEAKLTWSSDQSIGFGTSGTGDIPAFITSNPGNDILTANVHVAISVDSSCLGDPVDFVMKVHPTPVLVSPKETSVCDNLPFGYVAQSSATGITTYRWSRAAVDSISPRTGSGNSEEINEILHNSSAHPVDVIYVFQLSTGCDSVYRDSIRVTVNPTPAINPLRDTIFCNRTFVNRGLPFGSRSPAAAFTWTNSNPNIGLPVSGNGNIPAFVATNKTNQVDSAIITVSIRASTDSCAGLNASFKIFVLPSPLRPSFTSLSTYADSVSLQLCSESENINFNINAPATGVRYNWWSSVTDRSRLSIRDSIHANTVVSFFRQGTYTIRVKAEDTATSCTDTVAQRVVVTGDLNGISKERIFAMQPGNLLVYPDNSLQGYQWGYDSLISRTATDTAYSSPGLFAGQTNQFFIPDARGVDTAKYLYWVQLQNKGCTTRVYYNGPYRPQRTVLPSAPGSEVQLQIVPNPNNGLFEIALKGAIYGRMDARVYNSLGTVVFRKSFVKTISVVNEVFSTGHLPAGIYILEVTGSDLKKVVSRFVVQH